MHSTSKLASLPVMALGIGAFFRKYQYSQKMPSIGIGATLELLPTLSKIEKKQFWLDVH